MLKIGEFSKLAQVSGRTLRYYDELNLLKPQVIDRITGYRHYSVEQLPRLNRILALKELGFELERIADLVDKDVSSDTLRNYLLAQEQELEARISVDQARLQRVRTRLEQIDREDAPLLIDVTLKSMEAQVAAGNRMIIPTIVDIPFFARHLFAELYRWLKQHRIAYSTTQFILYHAEEYIEQDYDMEVAVILPDIPHVEVSLPHHGLRLFELPPVPLMATTIHQGLLRDSDKTVYNLIRWCSQQGYDLLPDGMGLREIHFFPQTHFDSPLPIEGLMELQLPIAKTHS